MSKHFGINGIGSDVQLGKAGGRLIYDGSNYKFTLSNGSTLENVQGADPVGATDFATKAYVDATSSGLDPKESCRVATVTDPGGTYNSSGGTGGTGEFTAMTNTIDGISLALGNRILLKDDATLTQNGIYVVTTVGTGANGVWERADDHDGTPSNEVSAGNYTFVEQGTVNANTGWVLQGNGIITLNSGNIVFVQFSGSGTYLGGVGITLNSPDFDLDFTSGMTTTVGIAGADLIAFADATNSNTMQARTMTNVLADLDIVTLSANGIAVRTAADTYTSRSIAVSAAGSQDGLAVTNGDGVSGNPTVGLDITGTPTITGAISTSDSIILYDTTATANVKQTFGTTISDLNIVTATANGMLARTAANSYASRTISAAAAGNLDGLSVADGDGVAGNPTIGLDINGTPTLGVAVATGDSLLMYDTSLGVNNEVTVDQLKTFMNAGTSSSSITEGNTTLAVSDSGTDGTLTYTADGTVVLTIDDTVATFQNGLDVAFNTGGTLTITDLSANRVVYTTTGGLLTSAANYTYNGTTLALTGGMDITGDLDIDNININGNTISSTNTNGNIILSPNGTGIVETDNITAPTLTALSLIGGASSSGTAAGALLLQGGDNSSTGTAGNIILTPGSSTSGTDGITIIQDEAGNEIVEFLNGSTAVNHISITPGATGVAPSISTNVTGASTNVDLSFTLKGTGVLAVVAGSGNYEDNVTADDDVPNKKYVDDLVAASAGDGTASSLGTVDFTSATAQSIGTLPANAIVLRVIMKVSVASDAATTCSVGDATNGVSSYMTAAENDPQAIDVYISDGFLANGGVARTINATVGTAGTVGSGTIIVEWRTA